MKLCENSKNDIPDQNLSGIYMRDMHVSRCMPSKCYGDRFLQFFSNSGAHNEPIYTKVWLNIKSDFPDQILLTML